MLADMVDCKRYLVDQADWNQDSTATMALALLLPGFVKLPRLWMLRLG